MCWLSSTPAASPKCPPLSYPRALCTPAAPMGSYRSPRVTPVRYRGALSPRFAAAVAGGPLSLRLGIRRQQILLQPGLHFAPPQPLVLGLSDPVPFVRKDDELAGHTLPLQCGEHRDTFRIGYPIIQLAVDHQRRRHEMAGEQVRRESPVLRGHCG